MKKNILFAAILIVALSMMSFAVVAEDVQHMDSCEYSSLHHVSGRLQQMPQDESQQMSHILKQVANITYEAMKKKSNFKPITVCKITMIGCVASSQNVQAEFNINSMELRVVENINGKNVTIIHSVVRNPYKGYSDDVRGEFTYFAGEYYFNL